MGSLIIMIIVIKMIFSEVIKYFLKLHFDACHSSSVDLERSWLKDHFDIYVYIYIYKQVYKYDENMTTVHRNNINNFSIF